MHSSEKIEQVYDVIVVGSGASGLAAAATAAHHGLSVLVLEKHDRFGGTSAWSGGWLWVPRNPLAVEAGITETRAPIRDYLRAAIGNRYDSPRIEAFLTAAPQMVGFFRDRLGMEWVGGSAIPDMLADLPGAGTGGRSVTVAPFDGRLLGDDLHRLRRPKRETSFFGMGIGSATIWRISCARGGRSGRSPMPRAVSRGMSGTACCMGADAGWSMAMRWSRGWRRSCWRRAR